MFNGKIHYKWSVAMVMERDNPLLMVKLPLYQSDMDNFNSYVFNSYDTYIRYNIYIYIYPLVI